ncbi:diaminopimelate decarboxylase [Pseudomonas sp. M5]|uniref:diaminopimelate decarboxylase n=1 Tax=Pseudomonas sp. M5 TaxID=1620788 RepID=UPI0018C962BB|nr:diaminopimelate decarboxylase [Pseudomonas sp. M5]MBM7395520.1 diaminopimelate decarboxylase [Pseudomonas sp. M5]QPN47423.1 diaminopimelate decarboxylase [Priestia aryabhattai]HDS1758845.1 diaminopimelate decarboxylase [Pseudomonas putida]
MNLYDPQRLRELAREFQTPLWCYDASVIRGRVEQLRSFDTVRYAQKANANTHLLRLLKDLGVWVDAVSLGEIERAVRAGYSNADGEAQIVYTSDVLDEATIARVIELNIPVNAGSPQMLEQIGRANPGHPIWLRINPGFGHGHSRKTNTGGEHSKHGNWHENLSHCYALIEKYKLRLIGLHMHIGSGVDYEHLQRVATTMVEQVLRCPFDIEAISAGGGLPVVYRESDREIDLGQYFAIWDQARKRIEAHLRHPVSLELEPGRLLVAEAGCLITQVRASKDVGRNHFVLVNAGFNDLLRPAMYGAYHQATVIPQDAHTPPRQPRPTVVAGALCEAGDVFTQSADGQLEQRLLLPVEVDDLIVFHACGAYGSSMSSNYNSRPLAAEVLLDGDRVRLIRRRQTIEELLQLEE